MSPVYPLRYEGGGVFRCLRPNSLAIQPGEVHGWQMVEARSMKSHDHFFACIHEAWKNLPEDLAEEFPSPDHLRKWALIKAGFCTTFLMTCITEREAENLLMMARKLDRFAIAQRVDKTVTVWTADSQRRDAQGRKEFQEAKEKALHIVSELIGTDITTLKQEAKDGE